MLFTYQNQAGEAQAIIEIYRHERCLNNDRHEEWTAVICTQIIRAPEITLRDLERIAREVCQRYHINPTHLVWINHHSAEVRNLEPYKENWDLVTFEFNDYFEDVAKAKGYDVAKVKGYYEVPIDYPYFAKLNPYEVKAICLGYRPTPRQYIDRARTEPTYRGNLY